MKKKYKANLTIIDNGKAARQHAVSLFDIAEYVPGVIISYFYYPRERTPRGAALTYKGITTAITFYESVTLPAVKAMIEKNIERTDAKDVYDMIEKCYQEVDIKIT